MTSELTIIQTIKTSVRFAKSWLFLLYISTYRLPENTTTNNSEQCILGLQSLIFIPICYLASVLKLPTTLYVSPLSKIFGNSFQLLRKPLYS